MERRRYEREAARKKRQRRQRRLVLSVSGVLLGAACMVSVVWFAAGQKGWLVEAQDGSPAEAQGWQTILWQGMEAVGTQDREQDGVQNEWSDELQSVSVSDENGAAFEQAVDLSGLYSRNAVLKDLETGDILAQHGLQERIYPASLTKIMTAVLAIEHTEDMDERIILSGDYFPKLYEEGASMAGFMAGEEASFRELLYGVLLPSGAECCMEFAYRIAGSEEAFAVMMNEKAQELGLYDTHFCNATGLHDPQHYSTVGDIAQLLQYALQNETFREAFTSRRYSTFPTTQHPDGFTFYSTMFTAMESPEVTGGVILGGKTGYTEEAGLCLASLAQIEGKEYILVTANAAGSHRTAPFHTMDAANVYSQMGNVLSAGYF